MSRLYIKLFYLALYLVNTRTMFIRNKALISKMMSNFHRDEDIVPPPVPSVQTTETKGNKKHVIHTMQIVLCRNFPTIPCDMIVKDKKLKNLIQKSIQQLKFKKKKMSESATAVYTSSETHYPSVDSEDLTNILDDSNTDHYKIEKSQGRPSIHSHKHNLISQIDVEEHETKKTKTKDPRKTLYNGQMKSFKKFYPHKIKYGDERNFKDYPDENLSITEEVSELNSGRKRISVNHQQPSASPVWRIDYMKHGGPSLNLFDYEPDSLKTKLMKNTDILSRGLMEKSQRKDVLHSDLYIKKKFGRQKHRIDDMHSDMID